MSQDSKEYMKGWYQEHKEEIKLKKKAYRQANKDKVKAYSKAYHKAHREEAKAYNKAWQESNKDYHKEYTKSDLNVLGQTKQSIRMKSQHYLKKYGIKRPGYEIHHCCSYTEPYKFIYCSREMHKLIHAYLRTHNIDADSDHYEQIKHLLDDTVVKYGLE